MRPLIASRKNYSAVNNDVSFNYKDKTVSQDSVLKEIATKKVSEIIHKEPDDYDPQRSSIKSILLHFGTNFKVCTYIYIYTYIRTYVHMHIHIHIYTYIRTYIHYIHTYLKLNTIFRTR